MPENFINHVADAAPAFRGLEAYSESDSSFFFGRKEEIKELTGLIKYNTLTLVFGKSGTGKTSLLNAGVFPLLRHENCLPFRIRLLFNEDSPSLTEQVWQLLRSKINDYAFRIENYIEGETLWEFFHREDLWKIVTPVFVFDQFEEIFTLANKYPERKEEVEELLLELIPLIENIVPEKVKKRYLDQNKRIEYEYSKQRVKVVFSFREDFLAEMESVNSRIPSVKPARFRLMAMNGNQANEVITGTWGKMINPDQATKIISYLVNDHESELPSRGSLVSRYDLLEIEPSLLSQVCARLDNERVKENQDNISPTFLDRFPKENILSSIYQTALRETISGTGESPADTANVKDIRKRENRIRHFIEDNLVDDKGFREKFKCSEVPPEIDPVVAGLANQFFIREDGTYIELTHDVMAGIIHKDRLARLKKDERNRAIKRALGWTLLVLIFGLLAFLALSVKVIEKVKEIRINNEIIRQKEDSIEKLSIDLKNKRKRDTIFIIKPDSSGVIRDTFPFPTVDTTKWTNQIIQLNQELGNCQLNIRVINDQLQLKRNELDKSNAGLDSAKRIIEAKNNEILALQKQLDSIKIDLSLFKIYGTHIETINALKSKCPLDVQQRIEALFINWEPFRKRAISQ